MGFSRADKSRSFVECRSRSFVGNCEQDSAIGHQAALTSTFSGVFTTRPWETWSLGIGIVCETTWIVGQQASGDA